MKAPLASQEAASGLAQSGIIIGTILIIGAVIYLRRARYIRRNAAYVTCGILVLILLVVGYQTYRASF